MFVLVVDGYEEQYEKRQHADDYGGRQRSNPQHRVGDHGWWHGWTVTVMVVTVVVVMVMVTVARTECRQRQKHEREQQRPENVLQETFDGRRHRCSFFPQQPQKEDENVRSRNGDGDGKNGAGYVTRPSSSSSFLAVNTLVGRPQQRISTANTRQITV